jgi:hypothetical protein
MNLRKDEKHDALLNEGEITQCLTDASDRESNVNALKGKSPGFSGSCSPSHPDHIGVMV